MSLASVAPAVADETSLAVPPVTAGLAVPRIDLRGLRLSGLDIFPRLAAIGGDEEEKILLLDNDPTPLVTAQARPKSAPDAPRRFGEITINKAKTIDWSLATNHLVATGGVEIVYTDPNDQSTTTLNADNAEYDATTGLLTARKGARLERTEGTFVGEEVTYNFLTRTGIITNAIAETDYFRMRGARIEAKADGSYEVTDGVFTTCIRGRPDYQIRARRLTVKPNEYVSARNVTFYAGSTPLIPIPAFRRSLRARSQVPTPLPGYSNNEGFFVRLADSPLSEAKRSLDLDLRVGFRRVPSGLVTYETDLNTPAAKAPPPRLLRHTLADPLRGYLEQLTPPTYREYAEDRYEDEFAPRTTVGVALQNDQFVYNRRRSDLRLSRFPEIAVHFINVLGHKKDADQLQNAQDQAANRADPNNPKDLNLSGSRINPLLQRTTSAPFLLDFNVDAGAFYERPTKVTQGRLSLQANLATQPILLGRRLSLRFALSDWINFYSGGRAYHLFSPETELDYLPTRTTRFGVGYRFANDNGESPFLFDERDVRHELRLLFQTGGPTAFGVVSKFDLERSRAYDTELAVVRNFDCMQVGLAYRLRSQQFSIIFNLLPPIRDRAARRAQPLQAIPGTKTQ